MRPTNNNLSPLPFYESTRLQYPNLPYTYGNDICLIAPKDILLPFQLAFASKADASLAIFLVPVCTDKRARNITKEMKEAGLTVVTLSDYSSDILIFPARLPMPLDMEKGKYYLLVNYGGEARYSEIMTVVDSLSGYTEIEWYDKEDMPYDGGAVIYSRQGYRNRLYVQTIIANPEYKFEEDGEERDGYYFPEKQLSEKTYKCKFLTTESVCDMLRVARLSDFVTVKDQYGRIYECDTFLTNVEWETGGVANVECEFETSTVVKRIGKFVNVSDKADFNMDFNKDYYQ